MTGHPGGVTRDADPGFLIGGGVLTPFLYFPSISGFKGGMATISTFLFLSSAPFRFLFPALLLASLVAQRLKSLPARRETRVQSLGQEDPLEKEMATHYSILAWEIPWTGGAWWATVHRVTKEQNRT